MRLTTLIRENLADQVLRHRFADEAEKLVADRVKFATEVYEDIYRKPDRDKMMVLPDGWLPAGLLIAVQFGDLGSSYENVTFDGRLHGTINRIRKIPTKPAETIYRRILEKHRSGCAKKYADDHRLSLRYQALKVAARDLQTRIEAAEKQIEAALNSVTTLPALLKAWPEIEPFTKRYFVEPSKLPALPVRTLNEMFKLPVGKAAQTAA
jgi:Nucleotide modification associated domain 5